MPSAPPSSADSRNTPNAIAGSRNVVSATVRSVNHDVPPSMSEGICKVRQAHAHVSASGPMSNVAHDQVPSMLHLQAQSFLWTKSHQS